MRKLLMLAVTALAALAFAGVSASTASAAFMIYDSDAYDTPCPQVSVSGNQVSGGCLIEDFEGTFTLHNFDGSVMGHYESTFDLVVDADGDGFAINPSVDPADQFSPSREACDEVDGTVRPWMVTITSQGPDSWDIGATVISRFRTGASGPGGACSFHWFYTDVVASPYEPTEIDQIMDPQNIMQDGYWESANTMWVEVPQ